MTIITETVTNQYRTRQQPGSFSPTKNPASNIEKCGAELRGIVGSYRTLNAVDQNYPF